MPTATVTASNLNLRKEPNGTVLVELPRGTVVEVIGDHGEWVQVSLNGFVSARYLRHEADATPSRARPPADLATVAASALPADAGPRDIVVDGDSVFGPGGVRFGRLHGKGLYEIGTTTIADYIASARGSLSQLPASLLRVMEAVSANEGRLEAVNTWDNAFMTFGCFQWTIGTDSNEGELPYVLSCLKRSQPETFQEHFGRHGLDVVGDLHQRPGRLTTGLLSLDGRRLDTSQQKEVLRQPIWAYRFWRAGHDDAVRSSVQRAA
jgi:hypothetical protein